ncbi:MAG: sulfatase-like hydrolase/transferase [Limisphaerales bacterium]
MISGFLTLNVASRERTPQPNVILIVVDDLGIGDLGCYGQRHFQTPRLDQMAQEGVRFIHYYSGSPVGAASRAVLMTGRHSGHATIRGNQKVPLEYGDYTLAEGLKQLSYASCAIGLWSMGQPGSTGLPNLLGLVRFFSTSPTPFRQVT